jgi:hypothetical protein
MAGRIEPRFSEALRKRDRYRLTGDGEKRSPVLFFASISSSPIFRARFAVTRGRNATFSTSGLAAARIE